MFIHLVNIITKDCMLCQVLPAMALLTFLATAGIMQPISGERRCCGWDEGILLSEHFIREHIH